MIGLRLDQTKALFFDREKVRKAVNRAERRALSNFGARVRTRAISSVLRHPVRKGFGVKSRVSNREGVSPPGTSPFAHLGYLPKFTFFAYDTENRSVIIGPARLNGVRADSTALRTLEEGGSENIVRRGVARRATYRARPWMRPAFEAELNTAAPEFKDTVRE
jgi:hypothetical protein